MVSLDPPYCFPLSPFCPSGPHHSLAFLPKVVCDVRAVEFARAYRAMDSTIEAVAFTVPRDETQFFQVIKYFFPFNMDRSKLMSIFIQGRNKSIYCSELKSSHFQDDLFPPTKVLWEPTLTAALWFAGQNR